MSDFRFPTVRLRLNRASLTATLSVCHAALLQDLRDRNFWHRSPAPSSARRPLALSDVPLSYSSPGSLAVTLVAIGRASCPFDCDYSHLPFIFASAKFSAHPLVIRRGMQCQAPRSLPLALLGAFHALSSSVWRRFP